MRENPPNNYNPNLHGLKQEDVSGFLKEIAQIMGLLPADSPNIQSQTVQSHKCSTKIKQRPK